MDALTPAEEKGVLEALRQIGELVEAPPGTPVDWAAVVALCDQLNAGTQNTAELAVEMLCNRLFLVNRNRATAAKGARAFTKQASAAEELMLRSLVLLDSLVKNVEAARAVVADKVVLEELEKIARLKEKTAAARARLAKKKKREQGGGGVLRYLRVGDDSEAAKILDGADERGDGSVDGGGGGAGGLGSAEEWAMRLIQSWGMLHPAEFPLYLKAMEKWKKAGVVFPAATQQDLLPLAQKQKHTRAASTGDPRSEEPGTRPLTAVVKKLCQIASETASLLIELSSQQQDSEESDSEAEEVKATLAAQCRDMRKAMAAVVEAALEGKSLPPMEKGGPRVLVYENGADQEARSAAVAYLVGVLETLESATKAAEQSAKSKEQKKQEKKQQAPEAAAATATATTATEQKDDVFNPFNLPESVLKQISRPAAPKQEPPQERSTAPQTSAPKASCLDELLGTAPQSPPTSTAPKMDALDKLLNS